MKELIEQINALCDAIKVDIVKTDTKAAQARVTKQLSTLRNLAKSIARKLARSNSSSLQN